MGVSLTSNIYELPHPPSPEPGIGFMGILDEFQCVYALSRIDSGAVSELHESKQTNCIFLWHRENFELSRLINLATHDINAPFTRYGIEFLFSHLLRDKAWLLVSIYNGIRTEHNLSEELNAYVS